jgi:hypothetical protein
LCAILVPGRNWPAVCFEQVTSNSTCKGVPGRNSESRPRKPREELREVRQAFVPGAACCAPTKRLVGLARWRLMARVALEPSKRATGCGKMGGRRVACRPRLRTAPNFSMLHIARFIGYHTMQIRIRVCDLQVIWGVAVGGVIPEVGNCDFWGLWRCSKNGTERRGSADRGGTLRRHFSVNRVLAAACKRAYILRMRRWTVPQLLFLGLAGLYFCDANAGAQFTSHYSCCPPGAFCDYGMKPISRRNSHSPQIYIDSLTFDGPIHLSATRLKQLLTTVKDNKFSTDLTSL